MSTEQITSSKEGIAIRIVDGIVWSIQFDTHSGAIIKATR